MIRHTIVNRGTSNKQLDSKADIKSYYKSDWDRFCPSGHQPTIDVGVVWYLNYVRGNAKWFLEDKIKKASFLLTIERKRTANLRNESWKDRKHLFLATVPNTIHKLHSRTRLLIADKVSGVLSISVLTYPIAYCWILDSLSQSTERENGSRERYSNAFCALNKKSGEHLSRKY